MIHVMLDGYQGNETRLDDIKAVNSVLNQIVASLGLQSVMPPFLLPYYYASDSEDDGISAFVILAGGHITIHTFPRRGCLFVDLLYDGYFDINRLRMILSGNFLYTDEKVVRTERRFTDVALSENDIWRGGEANHDFGPHIIARIDNVDSLSFENIFDMLDVLPGKINMLPICRPYVIKTSRSSPLPYISGVVLIAQSHIAFHYSVKEKVLFCDLFSCSFYKSEMFISYLEEKFGNNIEHITLIRGSKHDKQITDKARRRAIMGNWMNNIGEVK